MKIAVFPRIPEIVIIVDSKVSNKHDHYPIIFNIKTHERNCLLLAKTKMVNKLDYKN